MAPSKPRDSANSCSSITSRSWLGRAEKDKITTYNEWEEICTTLTHTLASYDLFNDDVSRTQYQTIWQIMNYRRCKRCGHDVIWSLYKGLRKPIKTFSQDSQCMHWDVYMEHLNVNAGAPTTMLVSFGCNWQQITLVILSLSSSSKQRIWERQLSHNTMAVQCLNPVQDTV